jgi:pimeloyl-ACP methyl ester carboxylesterase
LLRAVWLAAALLLALPALRSAWLGLTTACFLVEFLSNGGWQPLSAITREPRIGALAGGAHDPPLAADVYVVPAVLRPPGLVLVHGLAPAGKEEPRLRRAARLLARAGWAVAVPTVPGLTVLRLRPEDAQAVTATIEAVSAAGYRPVEILGVSLGAGPGLLAATDPAMAGRVSAVLALGGYASAVELLRYTLTGAFGFEGTRGRRSVDEAAIARFARANAELVDAAGRRLVENRDPAALDHLVAGLPAATRRLLDDLSPERRLGGLAAPLFLVHGRDDPAVPFTESLRLERAARAAGRPARVVIVAAVEHVDPEAKAALLRDLARLWVAFYAFRMSARSISAAPAP